MFILWLTILAGLIEYRLRCRVRRKNNALLTLDLSKKRAKRIVVEQDDMRALGWSSLVALIAVFVVAVSIEAFSFGGSLLLIYIKVVSLVSGAGSVLLLLWIAAMLVANRSEHASTETAQVFIWKLPLAIVYVLYLMLADYAQEHLVDVRSKWF